MFVCKFLQVENQDRLNDLHIFVAAGRFDEIREFRRRLGPNENKCV